jgi:hypothetical protein
MVACRYERVIYQSEFVLLRRDQVLSVNILNFFIRYLEEK